MKNKHTSPWAWIPTLYFAQGLPYVAVMTISVIMYKRLGISNTELAFYTGWLNLPWVIKPLWSPFIDLIKTKRWWIVTMQLLMGAGLAGIAFTIPTEHFFQLTLAIFWLLAFSSARMTLLPMVFTCWHWTRTSKLICRNPQYFLSHCDYCRTRVAYHACRKLEIVTDNIPYAWSSPFLYWPGFSWECGSIISLFFPIRIQTMQLKKFPLLPYSKNFLALLPVSFRKSRQVLLFSLCYSTVYRKHNWQKCVFLSL